MRWLGLSLLLIGMVVACDEVTAESYADLVERSRGCAETSECVLAGGGQCTCAQPVNASAVPEIESAVEDLDCEGAVVDCDGNDNVRCEAGRCISDQSP